MDFVDRGRGVEVEPFVRAWRRSHRGERGLPRIRRIELACRLLLLRSPARAAPDRKR